MTPCYVFDIDGTLADLTHRLPFIQQSPKNWAAFFANVAGDAPIRHICDLANTLSDADKYIVLVSGRSDECRSETVRWLNVNRISFHALYMREAGDHRPDNIVKGELLNELLADGYQPLMAFDDRNQVVEMWRSRGIPCAQVAAGDF